MRCVAADCSNRERCWTGVCAGHGSRLRHRHRGSVCCLFYLGEQAHAGGGNGVFCWCDVVSGCGVGHLPMDWICGHAWGCDYVVDVMLLLPACLLTVI